MTDQMGRPRRQCVLWPHTLMLTITMIMTAILTVDAIPSITCTTTTRPGTLSSPIYKNDITSLAIGESSSFSRAFLSIRGGSDVEEDELDDEEDVFDDFELGDDADDDEFAEDSIIDTIVENYRKTPPLTKGYLTASALCTILGYLTNGNQFPEILLLDWKKTLTQGQFWRPLTTFFNFGPLGLGYLLTVHFVWTYMSTLERLHHRKPYEFWIMIAFGMSSMVFGYPILKLNARFLGHNLSTFLVYMWSRYHEGMQVKMFELHTTRAELLPWYFLLQVCGSLAVLLLFRRFSFPFILLTIYRLVSVHRRFCWRESRRYLTFWGLSLDTFIIIVIRWDFYGHPKVL